VTQVVKCHHITQTSSSLTHSLGQFFSLLILWNFKSILFHTRGVEYPGLVIIYTNSNNNNNNKNNNRNVIEEINNHMRESRIKVDEHKKFQFKIFFSSLIWQLAKGDYCRIENEKWQLSSLTRFFVATISHHSATHNYACVTLHLILNSSQFSRNFFQVKYKKNYLRSSHGQMKITFVFLEINFATSERSFRVIFIESHLKNFVN
jgi:hypothetical protein